MEVGCNQLIVQAYRGKCCSGAALSAKMKANDAVLP